MLSLGVPLNKEHCCYDQVVNNSSQVHIQNRIDFVSKSEFFPLAFFAYVISNTHSVKEKVNVEFVSHYGKEGVFRLGCTELSDNMYRLFQCQQGERQFFIVKYSGPQFKDWLLCLQHVLIIEDFFKVRRVSQTYFCTFNPRNLLVNSQLTSNIYITLFIQPLNVATS